MLDTLHTFAILFTATRSFVYLLKAVNTLHEAPYDTNVALTYVSLKLRPALSTSRFSASRNAAAFAAADNAATSASTCMRCLPLVEAAELCRL